MIRPDTTGDVLENINYEGRPIELHQCDHGSLRIRVTFCTHKYNPGAFHKYQLDTYITVWTVRFKVLVPFNSKPSLKDLIKTYITSFMLSDPLNHYSITSVVRRREVHLVTTVEFRFQNHMAKQ